ncbi:hypothetical protein DSM03_101312 [Leeuwenhoekiella aestuarii]|uniref:Uncharacterized protein n=1 Tax=Leeuwenhoekiella aestuarii TaxID=2249426 RepID=A0A4Q0NSS4_9FLAO|nr:hypothetical protein [Leeuwenhoekiella aestuarii]RXG14195.1 hypothetical protein DSM04_104303 [Leeuwenhoekiella aestuarii]RXG18944.1 hypothetical protein DSM03_101312 [Leeuwenhoekiella aestuarii]
MNRDQVLEAAFIFERVNGVVHGDFENDTIAASELKHYQPAELEQLMIKGVDSGLYRNDEERVGVYWALSKSNNRALLPLFRDWLGIEVAANNNETTLFQLLVALDQLDEPVFPKTRRSRAADETELNLRDAKSYLSNI